MDWESLTLGITGKDLALLLLGAFVSLFVAACMKKISKVHMGKIRQFAFVIFYDIWVIIKSVIGHFILVFIGNGILIFCVYLFGEEFGIGIDYNGLWSISKFSVLVLMFLLLLLIVVYLGGIFWLWLWDHIKNRWEKFRHT